MVDHLSETAAVTVAAAVNDNAPMSRGWQIGVTLGLILIAGLGLAMVIFSQ